MSDPAHMTLDLQPGCDGRVRSIELLGDTVKFRTIVADPPWEYPEGFAGGPGHGDWTPTPLPYPSMSVAEICALPVKELTDKDCRLWLWTTNKYLPASLEDNHVAAPVEKRIKSPLDL